MPFIDIYRFKLDNYNNEYNYKFGKLKKANNGIIMSNKTKENETISINNIYSYDYLLGDKNIKDKYYNFYLNHDAKLLEDKNLEYNLVEKNYTTDLINKVLKKQLENDFINQNFRYLNLNNNAGYIKKVKLNDDEKIIIFGDHHGSFHTFYRNMLRLHLLGIINMENYTINPKYRLLFLGDLVDRGKYALEILTILFEFIIRDNEYRLMINRGNHEELLINERDGFKREIINKHSEDLWLSINKIFTTLPSCHIIINNNTKIWCCHGFVPIINEETEYFFNYLKEFTNNNLLNNNLLTDINISYQIRWNDPKIKDREYSRGSNIYLIDSITTKKYLELFDYIIRGHNDNYSNAFIIKKDQVLDFTKITDIIPELFNPMFKYREFDIVYTKADKKPEESEIKINKPIITIDINKKNDEFLNVLTISTNTDLLRNLIADSFILLRFDNDVNNVLPSPTEVYYSSNNIDFINNNSNKFITINEIDKFMSELSTDIEDDLEKLASEMANTVLD
jgi:hypothetical protein